MIAKKTSKHQLTLPKKVVDQFPDVDYFDVRIDESQITLVPVRPDQLRQVWSRLEELGISDRDVPIPSSSSAKRRSKSCWARIYRLQRRSICAMTQPRKSRCAATRTIRFSSA